MYFVLLDTEWFKILQKLLVKCVPTKKDYDLIKCLEYVGEIIMDKMKYIIKLKFLIEKIIGWIFNQIPFLKKALKFAEDFLAKIVYHPLHDCQKKTGFQFDV